MSHSLECGTCLCLHCHGNCVCSGTAEPGQWKGHWSPQRQGLHIHHWKLTLGTLHIRSPSGNKAAWQSYQGAAESSPCFALWQSWAFLPARLLRAVVRNNEEDGDVLHPSKAPFSALLWKGFGSLSGTSFTGITESCPGFRWNLRSTGESPQAHARVQLQIKARIPEGWAQSSYSSSAQKCHYSTPVVFLQINKHHPSLILDTKIC